MLKKPPAFLKKYFWDIDFDKLDIEKHRIYVLSRILDYGDEKTTIWMWNNFKKSEIKNILSNFRGLSQKSANFWALILNLPKEKVICLKRRSSKEPKTIWPY